MAESSQYERRLRAVLGLTTGSMYEHDVLAWAEESGVDGERVGLAERVRQAATHRGHADYKRLTNVTHNALWAVVAGWQEVVAAQDGHVEPIWAHATLAALATCSYVLAGVEAADRVAGRRDSQHDALQKRVAALEDEVHSLADATPWPDLGNPAATRTGEALRRCWCQTGDLPEPVGWSQRPVRPYRVRVGTELVVTCAGGDAMWPYGS